MAISYRKLWKLLIDKDMKKKDLRIQSGISTNALAKLGKNERVTTDVLEKVCLTLQCDVGDIMEISPEVTHTEEDCAKVSKEDEHEND